MCQTSLKIPGPKKFTPLSCFFSNAPARTFALTPLTSNTARFNCAALIAANYEFGRKFFPGRQWRRYYMSYPQRADPHSTFLYAREGRLKSFERGNYPPPPHPKARIKDLIVQVFFPHWDRRAIQPNHIKFRTCSALAPMWTPPIKESAELTRGPGGPSIVISVLRGPT